MGEGGVGGATYEGQKGGGGDNNEIYLYSMILKQTFTIVVLFLNAEDSH